MMILIHSHKALDEIRQRLQNGQFPAEGVQDIEELLQLIDSQAAELDALKRISLKLTSTLDLSSVLDIIVKEAMQLVRNAHDAHIYLFNKGTLKFAASLDVDGNKNIQYSEPRPDGLTYSVARTGEMAIVVDIASHPIFAGTGWTGSITSIPLKIGQRVVGVMNLARTLPGSFRQTEVRLLQLLADHAAIAIINANLHEAVSRQAYTDILTGLPNRRAMDERLEDELRRAKRFNRPLAVVMMDLDGFKRINDTYGHATGDMVLQKTFTSMAGIIRETDFLCRYGGDELTLILPEATLEVTRFVTGKIQANLRALAVAMPDGSQIHFDMSGGIAIYPLNGQTAADLLRAADEALYRAKRHQRGEFLLARGPTDRLMPAPGA